MSNSLICAFCRIKVEDSDLDNHYTDHYVSEGTWDDLVPIPSEEQKLRIDGYKCKPCGEIFSNNLRRKEYTGRGSLLHHIALHHGQLHEAMLKDTIRDPLILKSAIETLKGNEGSYDKTMVEVVEIPDLTKCNSKSIYGCPFCGFKNPSGNRRNLRFHIKDHYKDLWKDMVNQLYNGDVNAQCIYCKRKIPGANEDGWKNSMMCHLAIEHNELKIAMERDVRLPTSFVQDLFTADANYPKKKIEDKDSPEGQLLAASISTMRSQNKFVLSAIEDTDAGLSIKSDTKSSMYKCPFCNFKNKSGDRKNLRFHMKEHYEEAWIDKANQAFNGDLNAPCVSCQKKISASTEDGWKNSFISHVAIEHDELRSVMERDVRLTPNFVENLFKTKKTGGTKSSPDNQILSKTSRKRKATSSGEEDLGNDRRSSPGRIYRVNTEYIRKRRKIGLTKEDLQEDDDDDDGSDMEAMMVKKLGSSKSLIRRRNQPRRSASKPVKYQDDSDDAL